MDWLLKLLFILTYTDAPTAEGEFAPSLLLRAIGGWDDIEAVEDTHLLPREQQPAGPDPALGKLREAKAAAPDNDDEEVGKLRRVPIDEDDEDWDQELVARVLERYEQSFQLLDQMMEEPVIWIEAPPMMVRDGPADLFDLLGFSRPLQLRVRMYRERGDWSGAASALAELNRLSNFVMESPGPLVNYLVGMAIERNMLEAAQYLINDPEIPPQALPRVREILDDGPDREAQLVRVWKHEYEYQKKAIDDLAHGLTYDPAWLLALVFEEEPSEWDEFIAALRRCGQQAVASIAFQPNRTVRLASIMTEHAIAQTGLSCQQRRKAAAPAALSGERTWTAYLHSNGAAEYLLSSVVAPLLKALDRADFLAANREAVRALWGVRRYYQLHARLPESLQDLVPEILASVPRDPYDGGNVKYSAEKRRIWVLGEDMIDDGGMEDDRYGFRSSWPGLDEERFPYDPTLFFEWLDGGEHAEP